MGKGSEQRKLHRDDNKFRDQYDEAFTRELHKDTTANTATKRQVSEADRPAGVMSRTIYTSV